MLRALYSCMQGSGVPALWSEGDTELGDHQSNLKMCIGETLHLLCIRNSMLGCMTGCNWIDTSLVKCNSDRLDHCP